MSFLFLIFNSFLIGQVYSIRLRLSSLFKDVQVVEEDVKSLPS